MRVILFGFLFTGFGFAQVCWNTDYGDLGWAMADMGGIEYLSKVAIADDGTIFAGYESYGFSQKAGFMKFNAFGFRQNLNGDQQGVVFNVGEFVSIVNMRVENSRVLFLLKGSNNWYIAAFDLNGAPDPSFGLGGLVTGTSSIPVTMVLTNVNHILILHRGSSEVNVSSFAWSGQPNPSFGTNGTFTWTDSGNVFPRSIAQKTNGDFWVVGTRNASTSLGYDYFSLTLRQDGSSNRNLRFYPLAGDQYIAQAKLVGQEMLLLTNENGQSALKKILSNLDFDPNFGDMGRLILDDPANLFLMECLPDGRIWLVGNAYNSGKSEIQFLVLPSGTLDLNFGINGRLAYGEPGIIYTEDAVITNAGNLISVGSKIQFHDINFRIWQRDAHGELDSSFGDQGVTEIRDSYDFICRSSLVLTNGDVLLGGEFGLNNQTHGHLMRMDPNGIQIQASDSLFQQRRPSGLVSAEDGIYAAGDGELNNQFFLARFDKELQPDITFGTSGLVTHTKVGTNFYFKPAFVDDSGRLYGCNYGSQPAIWRFDTNGAVDPSFALGAPFPLSNVNWSGVTSILESGSGGIFAFGTTQNGNLGLLKLSPFGLLDPTFNAVGHMELVVGSSPQCVAMKPTPDGQYLLAYQLGNSFFLLKISPIGAVDPSFGVNGVLSATFGNLFDLQVLENGYLFAISRTEVLGNPAIGLVGILPNGTLDTTFGNSGFQAEIVPSAILLTLDLQTLINEEALYVTGTLESSLGFRGFMTKVNLTPSVSMPRKVEVQGLQTLELNAMLSCGQLADHFEWIDQTNQLHFGININPIQLNPIPSSSLNMVFEMYDGLGGIMASRLVPVLVSNNPQYFDLNGDGQNNLADWKQIYPLWNQSLSNDPNSDGKCTVQDYLYLNLDDE